MRTTGSREAADGDLDSSGPSDGDGDRYTVIGELARGGLGRVFLATDDALGRSVAIKQPLTLDPEALARFEREAKLTSRLQHAGVVPIYDVGAWADGEPFFVMKMVEGQSLDEAIRGATTLEARLALLPTVLAVADVIAYAHAQGVIHRDLKPANVIISNHGETVVIDWGLARLAPDGPANPRAPELDVGVTGLTQDGRVIGTPQFMPPEQAAGRPVDERADVYALGAVLYNVLAGQTPFPLDRASETLARVRTETPPSLQARVSRLPIDLVAIVEKAMAREVSSRYPSAGALADDLRRFFNGQLVAAQRYSGWMLGIRWVRRHRAAGALLAALVLSAIVGIVSVVRQRNVAVQARRGLEERQNTLVLMQAERSLSDEPTAVAAWLKRYQPSGPQAWLGRALAEEAIAIGVARHVFAFALPAQAVAVSPVDPLLVAGFSDGTLVRYDLRSGQRHPLSPHHAPITRLAFSRPSALLASGDGAGTVRVWGRDGTLLRQLPPAGGKIEIAEIAGLEFDPRGERLVIARGQRQVTIGSVAAGGPQVEFALATRLSNLAFCAGTGTLLVSELDGRISVLEPGAGAPRVSRAHHPDARLLCLPDGRRFVSAGVDGRVQLWDVATGEGRALGQHDDWVTSIAVSGDGGLIATGGGDDTIRLFSSSGGPARILRGHEDTIRGLAFFAFADGRRLASVASDSTVRVWDSDSGEVIGQHRSRKAGTTQLALDATGTQLVVTGPQEVRVWPLRPPRMQVLRGHLGPITSLAWSADGQRLASASRDRTLRVWRVGSPGQPSFVSPPLEGWTMFVRFVGPDDVLVNTRLGRPRRYDLRTGRSTFVAEQDGAYSVPAIAPGGQRLAYPWGQGVLVHGLDDGDRTRLEGAPAALADLAFTQQGDRVVLAAQDGLLGVWDVASAKRLSERHLGERIVQIALSPDDRQCAISTASHRLLLWDLRAPGGKLREVPTDRQAASDLFFSADARSLLYAAADHTLRLVDVASLQTRVLRGHRSRVLDVVPAPGASTLIASSDAQGFVRLWDTRTLATKVLDGGGQAIDKIAFSPSGRALAAGGQDALVRVWEVAMEDVVSDAGAPSTWMDRYTSARIDDGGQLLSP